MPTGYADRILMFQFIGGENRMSEDSEQDAVDQEEAIQENMFQVSALIALLEQKGLLTRQ